MTAPEERATGRFYPEDIEQLKKLADLYVHAKSLVLYSEEIDPTARSNIQVIKELRDVNDHLMRVIAARLSETPPEGSSEEHYCQTNLDKAIGHVYRAAFDSLDGTVLSLREKIVDILKEYPITVITDVLPEYWILRAKLEVLTQNISSHRATKDVAGNASATLDLYVGDTEEIKEFYKQVIDAGPKLDLGLKRHKKAEALQGLIKDVQEKYSPAVIRDVIPDFWQLHATSINVAQNLKASEKSTKPPPESLGTEMRDIKLIEKFYDSIIMAMPALDACQEYHHKEEAKETKKEFRIHVGSGIIYGVIYSAIVGAAGYFFAQKNVQIASQPIDSHLSSPVKPISSPAEQPKSKEQ